MIEYNAAVDVETKAIADYDALKAIAATTAAELKTAQDAINAAHAIVDTLDAEHAAAEAREGATGAPSSPAAASTASGGQKMDLANAKARLVNFAYQLDKLERMPVGSTSEDYCVYDVGTGSVHDHDPNATWRRQCRRHAVYNMVPPLCLQHARKVLRDRLVEGNAKIAAMENRILSLALANRRGIYNKASMTMNGAEFKKQYARATDVNIVDEEKCDEAPDTGAIYGHDNAVCVAIFDRLNKHPY